MRLVFFIIFSFFSITSFGSNLPQNIQEIIKGKEPKQQVILLDSIADKLVNNDYLLSLKIINYALNIAEENNLTNSKVNLYFSIIAIHRSKGMFDKALAYIDSAKRFSFDNKLSGQYPHIYNVEGLIHTRMGNYEKAAKAYYKAIEYAEKDKDSIILHRTFDRLGTMHFYRTDYKNAIKNYAKALTYLNANKISPNYVLTLDNIALCYSNLNNLDSALLFQRQVISHGYLLDSTFQAECYINIGSTLNKMHKWDEAQKFLIEGNQLHTQLNNEYGILISNLEIGKLYIQTKEIDKALSFLEKAYTTAEKLKIPSQIKESANSLADVYSIKGDYKKAALYYKAVTEIMQQIHTEENTKAINELSTKYESEKKEQKIQLLTKDKQIKEEEIEKERYVKMFIAVVASLFLIISIILFFRFKEKKKDNKLLQLQKNKIEEQKEQLQEKNQEITDSINYAKRIQGAVLPSTNYFQTILPDSFVYFKPKDIVSGDFYWLKEMDNYIYLALADCTGHGVPGAMMSMLGASSFNEIIQNSVKKSPSEILKELHVRILKTLNENMHEQNSVDGMDVALVRIDKKNKEVIYSGAGRPLYLVKGDEFIEYKSNKFSIGGAYSIQDVICEEQKISYKEKAIQIYLYSDGVTDQFGGEKGKKFMSKQLKSFVVSVSGHDMKNQKKQFEQLLEKWKREYDQIDDMTLISFKLS